MFHLEAAFCLMKVMALFAGPHYSEGLVAFTWIYENPTKASKGQDDFSDRTSY